MKPSQTERSKSPAEAVAYGLSYAAAKNFSFSKRVVGQRIQTTEYVLTDAVGRSAAGRGKGRSAQSTAAALFEAFEHYYYEFEDRKLRSSLRPLATKEHEYSAYSPDLKRLFSGRDVQLSCLTFRKLDEDLDLFFPTILVDPKFVPASKSEADLIEQSGIYRYSTNSGTASGTTKSEALLHGVMEIVERDALSVCFIKSVLAKEPSPLRLLDPQSLPSGLADLLDAATADGGMVTLWDITTDIGIPALLCRFAIDGGLYFGSGASLNTGYAIERAITEAIQVHHIQKHFGPMLQRRHYAEERVTLFQRCNLDAGIFAFRCQEKPVGFGEVAGYQGEADVETSLNAAILLLKRAGIEVFSRDIWSEGVYVCQTIAPALERFYLVMHGLPVAPSARGRMAAGLGPLTEGG